MQMCVILVRLHHTSKIKESLCYKTLFETVGKWYIDKILNIRIRQLSKDNDSLQRSEITAGKNVQLIPLFCHVL